MNRLTEIRLKNIVFFKAARFQFKPGLHGILGRNLNRRDPESSNGSGKSLLMGVIPNVWFDSHAHIVKNAKSVQKNIYGKNSAVEFDFIPHGEKVKYTYVKAGSKVRLLKAGKDMDSRVARDSMREKLHLSEEELHATVYVDSSRPNNFLMGNASDRFNFMTGLFRLDDIDEMRKIFGRRINDLREQGAALTVLQSEFQQAEAELKQYPKESAEKVAELKLKLKQAQQMLQRATTAIHSADVYAQYQKAKEALARLKTPSCTRQEARDAIAAWHKYEAEEQAYQDGLKRQERLRKKLDALDVKHLLPEFEAKLKLRDEVRAFKCDKPEPVEKPDASAAKAFAKIEQIRTRLGKLRGQIADRKASLAEFSEHFHEEGAECPTCTQHISKGTQKQIKAQLQESLDELKHQFETFTNHLNNAADYKAYQEYATELSAYKKYVAAKTALGDYPFEDVQKYKSGLDTLKRIQFKKPIRPTAITIERADTALGMWEMIDRAKALLATLGDPEPPEWPLEKAEKFQRIAQNNTSSLMAILPKLESKLELRKQTLAKLGRLHKEIRESKKAVVDLPVYEMLQKAYSPQGIKLLIIKSIANTLQTNLNRYAKQVFEEPFKFNISVESGKFDVMVGRKGVPDCDVKFFSGAERRLFVFVFLLALLPMIPARRRMNCLILDEPCANMDPGTQVRFRDVLLKALKKIVPCVVVVTPNPSDLPHGTIFHTAVKKGSESTLVEGVYR